MNSRNQVLRDQVHDQVLQNAIERGSRYTALRRQLIDYLLDAKRPLSIKDLQHQLRETPQSSLYRNVETLESWGVISRVSNGSQSHFFEVAEQLAGDHHHHMVCIRCGEIREIKVSDELEQVIAADLHRAAKLEDFELKNHQLDALGICGKCV